MNDSIFQQVQQLAEDYSLTKQGFLEARKSAEAVTNAVKNRLQEAQQANAQRITQLEERVKDRAAGETVRKVARLELDRLRATPPAGVLDSERELFNNYLQDAEQAEKELGKIRVQMREALTQANAELVRLRQSTLGDEGSILNERMIESARKDFARLGDKR